MHEPIRALYVHVPFCRNICGYCDFYKLPLRADLAAATVDALITELTRAADAHPLALRTIFFGGGTPTELPTELLARLATACAAHREKDVGGGGDACEGDPRKRSTEELVESAPSPILASARAPISGGDPHPHARGSDSHTSAPPTCSLFPVPCSPPPSCLRASVPPCLDLWEFTVEANPATVTDEKASVLRAAGVNRVSMGAQSFNRDDLRFLERTHQPEQVVESVALCRRHGFEAVNLDLIFGVPGQSAESWRASLQAAIDLGVDHLSCYGLTYEEGTTLHRRLQTGRVLRMENDLEADLYEATMDHLATAGFAQYEISNFARPGFECRHNLVYWRNEPHLAIGPSACGYVDGTRYKNVPDVRQYVEAIQAGRSPRSTEERLDDAHRARETAMLALRLSQGLDLGVFRERFGVEAADFFRDALTANLHDGLVELTRTAIRLTRAGRLVGDSVIGSFLRPA